MKIPSGAGTTHHYRWKSHMLTSWCGHNHGLPIALQTHRQQCYITKGSTLCHIWHQNVLPRHPPQPTQICQNTVIRNSSRIHRRVWLGYTNMRGMGLLSNVQRISLVWNCGPDSYRGSPTLTWYYYIITWFWRCDFHIFQKIKLRIDVQDNVLLTVLGIPMFPYIAPSTTFHVRRYEILFVEFLLGGASMINSCWWCYNY